MYSTFTPTEGLTLEEELRKHCRCHPDDYDMTLECEAFHKWVTSEIAKLRKIKEDDYE